MGDRVHLLEQLRWLGHASFRFEGPPAVHFDPYELKGGQPPADVILVTHEHYDHRSPADIQSVSGPGTVVIAIPGAAPKLQGDVRTLRPGERIKVGEIKVEAVPAYNVGKGFPPRRAEHVRFIVTFGGERLYFAGDSDRIPEVRGICCDVALLPVGGTYTMNPEEAACAASDIRPRVAVPMHYGGGIGTSADGEHFRSLCDGEVAVLEQAQARQEVRSASRTRSARRAGLIPS